ncbi:MAG: hypothetical protein HYX92_21740 [Chloroflexi bacterium]|nr:hypothetical protein [Chloroflexota bacterium]
MKTSKLLMVISFLTVPGLLLASCAPAAQPTPAAKAVAPPAATATTTAPSTQKPAAPVSTPKPAAEQPRYGGTLTVGIGGDPPTLDVHRENTGNTYAITSGTYSGLVRYDPHAWPAVKVIPDLATSWQISPDGRVYTFSLAKGAKFHDGSTVTADDVKYSLDRIRDAKVGLVKSPRRQQLANVTAVDAPDDSTVKLSVGHPQASFLSFLGANYYAVMPKRVVLEKKGDMTKTVVGSGAFTFKDYAVGVGWEIVKNPNYFVQGRPYLDRVKGYIIPDPFTRFAALRIGNINWWAPPSPYMTTSQAKMVEEQLSDKIALKWGFNPAWYGVLFNVTRPPWNDVRLRQAVSMTFDRKRMLAVGMEGAGVVGMAAQTPGEFALLDDEMMKVPGYAKPDLEGAKKLMAEAGFPDGFKAEALVRAVRAQQGVALLFKDAVAPLGITVDLNMQESAVFTDLQFRKAFTVLPGSSGAGHTDPDVILGDYYVTGAPYNYAGYSNPQFDELFAKQSQTLDAAERRKIVWEMQRILLRDVPIAIAYWSSIPYAWWKDVRGYAPPSLSHHHAYMYQDIWLAK